MMSSKTALRPMKIRGGRSKPSHQHNPTWWSYLRVLNPMTLIPDLLFSHNYYSLLGILVLVAESVLCCFAIHKVKYTEIDWVAYMQEVEGFLNGTWDYTKLEGQTGPLVYPAGFEYVYAALYAVTSRGSNIRLAQYIFACFYLLLLATVIAIYGKTKSVPPFALLFMSFTAYRIHSIFLLRLFNDAVAMVFLYLAVLLLLHHRFTISSLLFSFAISIKMNIILFLPAWAVILVLSSGYLMAFLNALVILFVQILLAIPFLWENPAGYFSRAFNFGRQFLYKWTVNWRFLTAEQFNDRRFHLALLLAHLFFLLAFAFAFWFRNNGGLLKLLFRKRNNFYEWLWMPKLPFNASHHHTDALFALFTSNFIGILFSRTLHYQFYVWYYHSIPFLLWSTTFRTPTKLLLWGLTEYCWNVYPSTNFSSALLQLTHWTLFLGLCAAGRTQTLAVKHHLT